MATILIAGGATGIGRAAMRAFRAAGDDVLLADVNEAAARDAVAEPGPGRARALTCDFSDPAASPAAVAATLDAFGNLDTVFVNVGLMESMPLQDWTLEAWNRAVAVNLTAPFLLAQAAAPHLARSPNASLIVTSSTGAMRGHAGSPAYHATKTGVLGLVRSLADELAPRNIRVNCVLPGWIDTPFNNAYWSFQPDPAAAEKAVAAGIPMGRQGTPEEVTGLVLFLASPAARYITGSSMVVDGGYTAV